MRKLENEKGETIIETLVALMIVVLAMLMLSGGIASAAKVNQQTKEFRSELSLNQASVIPGFSVSVTHAQGNESSYHRSSSVTGYLTESGYVYYETEE